MAVPTAPVVSFSDNADATGAVATVDGDPGVTNTIFVQRFDDNFGTGSWTNAGSRSGDGTVSLTLAVGHYLGYAQSSNVDGQAISLPAYFAVTTGAESLHYRCLGAVRTRLGSAGLAGIAGASIVSQHVPLAYDFFNDTDETPAKAMPGVIVSPYSTEEHDPDGGTSYRNDFGYGCLVTIFAAHNGALSANLDARLKWREQAIAAFGNQRLLGVPEVMRCTIEPAEIVNPQTFEEQIWHSAFVVRCFARVLKGLGV